MMYLLDTNVVSESRKQHRVNFGVQQFLQNAKHNNHKLFISVVTLGELRRGVENIRHRGDLQQAQMLENWLLQVEQNQQLILPFDKRCADIWGRLLVTRNVKDFQATGVKLLNPFEE